MMPSMIGISRPGLLGAFMRIAANKRASHSDQIAALTQVSKATGLFKEAPTQATQIVVNVHPSEEGL